MTFKHLVSQIESLPPLSDVAISIQSLYAESGEYVNIIKLVRLIELDAILTANILKMINAPYYGFSHRIASISQAVTLFGTHVIYGIVLNFAIQEKLKAETGIYGLSNTTFNEMCHLQKALMLQWYSKVDLRDAQFLAPLALMMETGKLILEHEIVASDYLQEYLAGLYKCENIQEYEKDMFETTSYFVSGLLFEHWNLEPLYVDILKGLDFKKDKDSKMKTFENELNVIRTAINVKEILSDKSIREASRIVRNMGLSATDFEHVAYRIRNCYTKQSDSNCKT